jgi:hypothetical protein
MKQFKGYLYTFFYRHRSVTKSALASVPSMWRELNPWPREPGLPLSYEATSI